MNKVVKAENAKIVIPTGSDLINIIGEMAGVVPLDLKNVKSQ